MAYVHRLILLALAIAHASAAEIAPAALIDTGSTLGYGELEVCTLLSAFALLHACHWVQLCTCNFCRTPYRSRTQTTENWHTQNLQEEWRGETIHLSWAPRAFLLKGFLTDEECDYLVDKVRHGTPGKQRPLIHRLIRPPKHLAAGRPYPSTTISAASLLQLYACTQPHLNSC
jgi:hypothetical protein